MRIAQRIIFCVVLGSCLVSAGCQHLHSHDAPPPDVPREKNKTYLADYIINPPDILVIDLLRAVPIPPYKIKPQDLLYINVKGIAAGEDAIKGVFRVEPDGTVHLGPSYGSLSVEDLSLTEATRDITKYLKTVANLKDLQVAVSLEETRGVQLVRGEHLVRPDGSVNLGAYGRVVVGGMNQETAKAAIEAHLAQYFLKPQISIDIGGFNSSVYYVIYDGGGLGEQVYRLSHTGSETVLDAIGQISGLPTVASTHRIWLARPTGDDNEEVLPIDWRAITRQGSTATNYQIFPGDRIYVAANPLVTLDTFLARLFAPAERIFGMTLLGTTTITGFGTGNLNSGSSGVR